MPKVDLAYCMTLPPKEAVAYLTSKGYTISWDWEEVWQDAHASVRNLDAIFIQLDLDVTAPFRILDGIVQNLGNGKGQPFLVRLELPVTADFHGKLLGQAGYSVFFYQVNHQFSDRANFKSEIIPVIRELEVGQEGI